jgi:hypothetical protein
MVRIESIQIRNPHVIEQLAQEMEASSIGRNMTEAAASLILEAIEQRRVRRAAGEAKADLAAAG